MTSKNTLEEKNSYAVIEYEIHMSRDVDDNYDFQKLEEFIEDQCKRHEGKRELRITVKGIGI